MMVAETRSSKSRSSCAAATLWEYCARAQLHALVPRRFQNSPHARMLKLRPVELAWPRRLLRRDTTHRASPRHILRGGSAITLLPTQRPEPRNLPTAAESVA